MVLRVDGNKVDEDLLYILEKEDDEKNGRLDKNRVMDQLL